MYGFMWVIHLTVHSGQHLCSRNCSIWTTEIFPTLFWTFSQIYYLPTFNANVDVCNSTHYTNGFNTHDLFWNLNSSDTSYTFNNWLAITINCRLMKSNKLVSVRNCIPYLYFINVHVLFHTWYLLIPAAMM